MPKTQFISHLICCLGILLGNLASYAYESYYSPGTGTAGIVSGWQDTPVVHGDLPLPVVITSDLGRYMVLINPNGQVSWRIEYSTRGACYDGATLWGGNSLTAQIDEMNASTGQIVRSIADVDGGINSLRCHPDSDLLVVSQRDLTPVLVYRKDGTISYTSKNQSYWGRGSIVVGRTLYIADSFRHQVYIEDIDTAQELHRFPAFFPADFASDGDVVYLAEEHANRIVKILPGVQYARTVEVACPHPLFSVIDDGIDITEQSGTISLMAPRVEGKPMSVCSKEHHGLNAIYSPNGIGYHDGYLYVGDTDNHRVMVYRQRVNGATIMRSDFEAAKYGGLVPGDLVAVITNLNNPNKVIPIY